MSFKIEFVDKPKIEIALDRGLPLRPVLPHEIAGEIEGVFPFRTIPSNFYIIWHGHQIGCDLYEFGELFVDWLHFAIWMIEMPADHDHFDPWSSGFQLSFDAKIDDDNIVTVEAVGGDIFNDAAIPNSISAPSTVFLLELAKLFNLVQLGLASKHMKYEQLDDAIVKINLYIQANS